MSLQSYWVRLKNNFQRRAEAWLARLGYARIQPGAGSDCDLQTTLERLQRLQSSFRTVIDVGASNGSWTQKVMQFFPAAEYLLFECDERQRQAISNFCAQHPNAHLKFAAASDRDGDFYLLTASLDSGAVHSHKWDDTMIPVVGATLDGEVKRLQLPAPYFIKLDTHGFELPILEGASGILEQTEFLMVEVYNFKVHPKSLHFSEMCAFLDQKGFRPMFMCDPLFRARDGALWQFDLIFARKDRHEFQFGGWG